MLDAALCTPLLVDVTQSNRGGIILHQPHLWGYRDDAGHGEMQQALARFLLLRQEVVEHAQQL